MPSEFSAGTTQAIRQSWTDYPASDGWACNLYLAGASVPTAIAATTDGDDFIVTIPATLTTKLGGFNAGLYQWQMRVTKDEETHLVESGRVTVTPNLAEATANEHQSWLERTIVVLRAYIENRSTAGVDTYSVAGRAVSKWSVSEASNLLAHYESQLARLQNPTAPFRTVLVSFTGTET